MVSKSSKDIKTTRAEPQESAGTQRGFLRRWSERKGQAHTQKKLPASSETPVNDLVSPAPVDERTPPLTDADMPPIDKLDEKSDYRGFLSPEVSEDLRRLALRKLFHLPKFNIRDGLDDYDEDYRTFEALGNIVTAHERRQLELQEDQEPLVPETGDGESALAEDESEEGRDSHEQQLSDETASNESEDGEHSKDDGERSRDG